MVYADIEEAKHCPPPVKRTNQDTLAEAVAETLEMLSLAVDEVIQRANTTMYGLAAAVWTQDISKAHAIANNVPHCGSSG